MSDFWTDTERKARKTHTCIECHRTIQPGETYTKSAGVWEGDFYDAKRCGHCMAYMCLIRRQDSDALDETWLRDWVHEYGLNPVELIAYNVTRPLEWLRWGTWFTHRWTDVHGNLRDIPTLSNA
jgi:hypothetical protein